MTMTKHGCDQVSEYPILKLPRTENSNVRQPLICVEEVEIQMNTAALTDGDSEGPMTSSGCTVLWTIPPSPSSLGTMNVIAFPLVNSPRWQPFGTSNFMAFAASNFPRIRGPTMTYANVGFVSRVFVTLRYGREKGGSWLWKPEE